MLSLYKRGRIFWARGSVRGSKIRVSLDTMSRQTAHSRLIDLELRGGRQSRKWSDFEQEFHAWKQSSLAPSTRKRYKWILNRFGQYLTLRGLSTTFDITPEVLAGYSTDRQTDRHPHNDRTLAIEGLRQDLRILHGVFSYAVKCGYLEKNPVIATGLNVTGGKTLPFTPEEVAKLLGCPYVKENATRYALVLTFLYTGLRISDVAGLERAAVNLEADTISLRTQKRKKYIFLPLHPALKQALQGHWQALSAAQRESGYLFPTKAGRRIVSQSLDAYLRRCFIRAGIASAHAHRFRDTFAVRLLSRGASLYDVSKLMGITVKVAERHYAPYVLELQERGKRLVDSLDFTVLQVCKP